MLPQGSIHIFMLWIERELRDLHDEMARIRAEEEADMATWGQWEEV